MRSHKDKIIELVNDLADDAGKLHISAVQHVPGRVLVFHLQKSPRDQKQDFRRNRHAIQDWPQAKVIFQTVLMKIFFN